MAHHNPYYKPMPNIDINQIRDLTDRERKIVELILNKGALRASRPTVARQTKIKDNSRYGYHYGHLNDDDALKGEASYVWRMVAFQISPIPQHQCIPCTQDSDIGGRFEDRKKITDPLDNLVERIVDSVDPRKWHGIKRWGNALGLLGTPQLAEDGSYIYR